MKSEPRVKRACVFIDGQNLFNAAKLAFGYRYPNYDPQLLARKVCAQEGWQHHQTYFYTGVPDANADPGRHQFWVAKMAVMGTRGVRLFSRPMRYRNEALRQADGTVSSLMVGREKGIDVRMALDIVRLARERVYDVAVVFTQDQDFSEVADEVRAISDEQDRWLWMASAYPVSPTYDNRRGVNKTEWLKLPRSFYDACIDPNDYRTRR